ncbi:MAG: hypothetical protein ChlgKO_04180 [Chlamydiales bacterium]
MTTPVGPGGTPESKRPDDKGKEMKSVSKKMESVWGGIADAPKAAPGKHSYSIGFEDKTTSKVAEDIRSRL